MGGCPCCRRCRCRHSRASCRHCAWHCCCCCHHCRGHHCGVIPAPLPPLPTMTAASMALCLNCRCLCCCRQRGGGGSACVAVCRHHPLQPIAATSLRGFGIISAFTVAAVLPPHPCLPFRPATMGGVAVDVYQHDKLNHAHGLADGVLVPMFPPSMGWAGGGGEGRRQRGSSGEEEGSCHQALPTSTSTSTSSTTRARATNALVVIIIIVVAMGITIVSAAATAAASERGAVLTVVDAWLQPGVEAWPAVEVAAAGHSWLVGHCLEADGA
jgi:hypothetical protein